MTTFSTSNVQFQLVDSAMAGSHALQFNRRVKSSTVLDLSVQADAATLSNYAGLPMRLYPASFSTTTYLGTLRLRTTQTAYVPGGGGKLFDVQQQYDTMYRWTNMPGAGTGSVPANQYVLPIESGFEARTRDVEVWRASPVTSPTANQNSASHIGGTAVDTSGVPVKSTIMQTTYRLSMIVDASGAQNSQTLTSLYDDVSSIRGKWNTNTFLHWSPQTLVCEAADLSHVRDEFWRATYLFIWDEWFLCDQMPQRDRDGFPTLGSGPPYHASDVRWKSVVRGTADFSVVWGTQPNATIAEQMAKEGTYLSFP